MTEDNKQDTSFPSGGKCTECKSCTPYSDETGCTDGTESCSDGCGGTRLCCKDHTHSYSCPSGYSTSNAGMISPVTADKVCSCGATSGTCYKEGHSHSYSCPSGYSSSNSWGSSAQTASKTCSCGAASGTCYKAPAHTHSYSCPSGYSETKTARSCKTTSKRCSCGATSGTCYREFICTDVGTAHRDYPTSICTLSVTVITGCGYTIQCYSCRSCNSC